MPDPHLRAADSDRAAIAEQLGRHLSDGRLTVDEYDERLSKAYAAKTYGELDELLADLPRSAPAGKPAAAPAPATTGHAVRHYGAFRAAWASWLSVAIIVTAIWAFTVVSSGHLQGFWPIWVVGPWGAVLLSRTVSGRPYPGGGRCYGGRRRSW